MITWKYLVPKHASKKVDGENKTKNPDVQNMVPPKIHLNNNVIAEEDEEEVERENNKEDEIKEFGRKLIIYDDNYVCINVLVHTLANLKRTNNVFTEMSICT